METINSTCNHLQHVSGNERDDDGQMPGVATKQATKSRAKD